MYVKESEVELKVSVNLIHVCRGLWSGNENIMNMVIPNLLHLWTRKNLCFVKLFLIVISHDILFQL